MLGEYEMKPKNVVVLMGGISPEREISLRSGNAVARALKEAGFNVTCIDVKDEKIEELDHMDIDVAFIALHGYFGEDGGVQRLLELKGIPYTGSGINASRLAMDKLATKKCFIEAGLKTPDYITATEFQELQEIQQEISKLGLPVVLKPTRNGSSIGISIIKNINDLQIGLEKAFEFGYELLVEKYVKGRELTVGILDDKALPVEIDFEDAALGEEHFEHYRDRGLLRLAPPDAAGRKEQVLRELLADGRGAQNDLALLHVALMGFAHRPPIEAPMAHEVGVLSGNHRLLETQRDGIVGDPAVRQPRARLVLGDRVDEKRGIAIRDAVEERGEIEGEGHG
jgi:hypothetical protein